VSQRTPLCADCGCELQCIEFGCAKKPLPDSVPRTTWEEMSRCYLEQFDRAERLQRELNAKQAVLDRVMLEYCPGEMTEEQMTNWKKHQRPVHD
jgi:hypothetical protein